MSSSDQIGRFSSQPEMKPVILPESRSVRGSFSAKSHEVLNEVKIAASVCLLGMAISSPAARQRAKHLFTNCTKWVKNTAPFLSSQPADSIRGAQILAKVGNKPPMGSHKVGRLVQASALGLETLAMFSETFTTVNVLKATMRKTLNAIKSEAQKLKSSQAARFGGQLLEKYPNASRLIISQVLLQSAAVALSEKYGAVANEGDFDKKFIPKQEQMRDSFVHQIEMFEDQSRELFSSLNEQKKIIQNLDLPSEEKNVLLQEINQFGKEIEKLFHEELGTMRSDWVEPTNALIEHTKKKNRGGQSDIVRQINDFRQKFDVSVVQEGVTQALVRVAPKPVALAGGITAAAIRDASTTKDVTKEKATLVGEKIKSRMKKGQISKQARVEAKIEGSLKRGIAPTSQLVAEHLNPKTLVAGSTLATVVALKGGHVLTKDNLDEFQDNVLADVKKEFNEDIKAVDITLENLNNQLEAIKTCVSHLQYSSSGITHHMSEPKTQKM